jgi:hypothetical protein
MEIRFRVSDSRNANCWGMWISLCCSLCSLCLGGCGRERSLHHGGTENTEISTEKELRLKTHLLKEVARCSE